MTTKDREDILGILEERQYAENHRKLIVSAVEQDAEPDKIKMYLLNPDASFGTVTGLLECICMGADTNILDYLTEHSSILDTFQMITVTSWYQRGVPLDMIDNMLANYEKLSSFQIKKILEEAYNQLQEKKKMTVQDIKVTNVSQQETAQTSVGADEKESVKENVHISGGGTNSFDSILEKIDALVEKVSNLEQRVSAGERRATVATSTSVGMETKDDTYENMEEYPPYDTDIGEEPEPVFEDDMYPDAGEDAFGQEEFPDTYDTPEMKDMQTVDYMMKLPSEDGGMVLIEEKHTGYFSESGFLAKISSLFVKKESSKTLITRLAKGDLSEEQLEQIVEAKRAGLNDSQIMSLIKGNKKLSAKKMRQLIQIAVEENKERREDKQNE